MSTKLNIVNTFNNSTKKPIVFLVLIGIAGLLLRLAYVIVSMFVWEAIFLFVMSRSLKVV